MWKKGLLIIMLNPKHIAYYNGRRERLVRHTLHTRHARLRTDRSVAHVTSTEIALLDSNDAP